MNQPFEMFFLVAVITTAVFWRDSEASTELLQNISQSATATIGAAADLVAVIEAGKKFKIPKSSHRVRRSPNSGGSSGKVTDGLEYFVMRPLSSVLGKVVHKFSPTFIPGDWGDITNPAVRSNSLLTSHSVFASLSFRLDESFKDIIAKHAPATGDVISCRMTGSSSIAEHYMMVYDNPMIIEVGTPVGTTFKNSGSMQIIPFNASNYYESKECLFHRNSIIDISLQCDELNEKNTPPHQRQYVEYRQKWNEILERVSAMITAVDKVKKFKGFNYRTLSCNCQDLVLYWAYGYVYNRDCIAQLFPNTTIVHEHSLDDLKSYYDSHLEKYRGRPIINV